MTLAKFMSYLYDKKMIDATKLKDDTDDGFENRLKAQKYVYIAKYFGLDLGHRYDFHLHGPYSRGLTKDYFNLNLDNLPPPSIPSGLKEREFLSVVNSKSVKWLEIAATILFAKKNNETTTLEHLCNMKPDHKPEFINSVSKDVSDINIH